MAIYAEPRNACERCRIDSCFFIKAFRVTLKSIPFSTSPGRRRYEQIDLIPFGIYNVSVKAYSLMNPGSVTSDEWRMIPMETEDIMRELENKRILMIIASKGYRDEELSVPKKMFEDAGATVDIAADKEGRARGMLGSRVESDIVYSNAEIDKYDAVIFVGGVGSQVYWNDLKAHSLAKETIEKNKLLGAICLAPPTLAHAGVLKGKTATSYTSAATALKKAGANYTGQSVEVDGSIVTGDGPTAVVEFAQTIIDQLDSGQPTAN